MSKNAITVIDQERIDLFKDLASKAENENEYCITLNINIFNDFISDHESLIEINSELTKREQKYKKELEHFVSGSHAVSSYNEIKKLKAENAALRKQSEWISVDITNIKIGSKLSYRNGKDSIVFDISDIVNDGINGGISQCRIWANITGAKGIYHTYRKDGVSHYEPGYDIVKITPPKGE